MATWLNIAGGLAGKAGKAIDVIGKATGNRLPELNISENLQRLGGMYNPRPVYAAEQTQPSYDYSQARSVYSPPPTVLGTNTTQRTSASNAPSNIGVDPYANINQNVSTGNSQIDADYNDFINQLSGAEQGLQSQAANASAQVATNYAPQSTALKAEEATKLSGLASQTATAQGQEKTAMQQSRDLFRQTQQQNIAQTSGLGISSSSVTEALAETLGVETARRIASVSQSANDIYNNIAREKTNVETFVKSKLADLEGRIAQEKSNIQLSLLEGIRQINEARATAAKDKANRRADLLQNAQNAIYGLQQNAQTFTQSLEAWKAQNTSSLNAASQTDYNQLFANNLQQIPQINRQLLSAGMQGDYTISPTGQMTTKITNKKITDPNDPNYDPFAPQ